MSEQPGGIQTTGEESVEVGTGAVDAQTGQKLEPEEQPARVRLGISAPVKLGRGPFDPDATPVGSFGGSLAEEGTALEVAQRLGTRCELCANWRRADWQRLRAAWAHPLNKVGREMLDRMRGVLMDAAFANELAPGMSNGDNALDVEHALAEAFAICGPLSEIEREVIVVPYNGGCPTSDSKGMPLSSMFMPRDGEARSMITKTYDLILRAAQGRNGA